MEYRLLNLKNITTMAIPFSARTKMDLHIVFCNKIYRKFEKYCYWIIIGGWQNTKSVIRRCPTGVPKYGVYPINSECAQIQASLYVRYAIYFCLETTSFQLNIGVEVRYTIHTRVVCDIIFEVQSTIYRYRSIKIREKF